MEQEKVALADPFQWCGFMQKALANATSEDVRQLDLIKAAHEINYLHLLADVENLG